MTSEEKKELLIDLEELDHNCGDIRGRNGEYLDLQVTAIMGKIKQIKSE